jgi:phospholipase/lecithinase/hemolysin
MKTLRALFASVLLLFAAPPALAYPYSQVVVFGDSNVDNGNLRALLGPGVNPPPNFGGRNSNGPVVVEYLANSLGVPLLDFAYSGATTGAPGLSPAIPHTLTQIQNYFGTLAGGMADPNALFIYWAGSNDILLATTPPAALQGKIDGAMANIDNALRQLNGRGAQNILVATRTPRPSLTSVDNLNGVALNTALKSLVSGLDALLAADIEIYDAYGSVADMVLNPSNYGFSQNTALCINNNGTGDNCANNLNVAAGYINWDAAHKTTRVHQLMAQQILMQVPAPGTLWLVLPVLAILALGSGRKQQPLRALAH